MLQMETKIDRRDHEQQSLKKKQEYLNVNKDNRIRFKIICIFTVTLVIIFLVYQLFPQPAINEHSANVNANHHDDITR